jgi:hypothetical protein
MKTVSAIKSISIVLLVMLAFLQFSIIISDNFTGFSNLFGGKSKPLAPRVPFSYDYISLESIRISDGMNNFWDMPRRTDEYYQLQLIATEVLKQIPVSELILIHPKTWEKLLTDKYIMFQYFCTIPLSFVSPGAVNYEESIEIDKIRQLLVRPTSAGVDFYIFDGSSYFQLKYDASKDFLINSIDYDGIFNFIQYTDLFDENTYKLLGFEESAYQINGENDVKLFAGLPLRYQLAISVTPTVISDIMSLEDTYELGEIKSRLLGAMQDRFMASISANHTVFFSNTENQYALSHDGRISYDYFGKQSSAEKGSVDMAYGKALTMLERVLGLMDEKSSATLVLTDIDYSNPRYYIFSFDYLVEGKLVYIYDNPSSETMEHAFVIQAGQDRVLKMNGILRAIFTDKETYGYYENNTVQLITDMGLHLEDHYIKNIYNGYILNAWSGSSTLMAGMLIEMEKGLKGIPLPLSFLNFAKRNEVP